MMLHSDTFIEEKELGLVRSRYENILNRFPLTVQRLRLASEFEQVYWQLKEEGLKDWHILQSIGNITVGYRTNYGRGYDSFDEMKDAFMDQFVREEAASDLVVPIDEYSAENMQMHLDFALASYLLGKGYILKARTPNFTKLREFADRKYMYFQLDIKHEPLFKTRQEDQRS